MDGRKLSENRFRILFLILRAGGLPIYVKKVSILYKIYIALAMVATYSMFLAIAIDAVMHRDDLKHAMVSTRAVVGISDFLWPITYLR